MLVFALLAVLAGAAIALQASMNAQLGMLLKSSMLATSIAFMVSFGFAVLVTIATTHRYPQLSDLGNVPFYLWFSGGALAAFGVGMFYFLIPKMGVGAVMSFALTGQLCVAIFASHFGWFELPIKQLDWFKCIGLLMLVSGVFLINWHSAETTPVIVDEVSHELE
ncbi:DMT family transporter [Paraglaciecola aquimarina]|uniref:DMT family transporter n=1 Tax=Paraglaciecola aquimarina TaxID=1235557 RepID=A0ABU3SRN7_9ALTE|nr:DMT family transporter [Paraglaciecola aquimarina]MDU0352678.1 DMT family transporter [Paraglaciecola aquimarina]